MTPAELAALSAYQQEQERSAARNQPQGGGIIDTLGKVALGTGLAAAGLYGAKRLGGTVDLSGVNLGGIRRKLSGFVAPKGETPGTPLPSRPAPPSEVERLKTAEDVERIARAERPQGVSLVDTERRRMYAKIEEPPVGWEQGARPIREITPTSSAASRKEVYEAVAAKPDEAVPFVSIPGMESDVRVTLTDPRTGEIFKSGKSPESFKETYVKLHGTPGTFAEFSQEASALQKEVNTAQAAAQSDFGPQQYLKSQQYVEADNLVDQHQVKALGRIDQTVNAIDTAEDQMTGRVRQQLQRNEDVNLSAVDQIEDVTNNIDVAASQFEDGLPVDQAERLPKDPWAGSATVPVPQRQTAPSTETKLLPSAAVSPREKSQQFLQQKFEELGATIPSPTRRERILSADPALAEAYELYASTGDPSVLSRLSETPSSPVNVTLREQSEFVSPEVSTKSLYKPGVYPEYVGDLIEKDIELTNRISSLSQEKLNIAARQKELGEQELMLKNAMAQEPTGRDSYSRMLGKVKYEQQNLPAPESLNVDIGDAMAERDFTRVQLESAENLGPRYKLTPREEGTRAFYEQTPEGQIIPETLEIRGGRPSVELEPKRGGGRGAAEYDPSGQTGSRKGTYGLESTRYPQATSAQRPTQYTADELVQEALEQATASLEGDVPIPPPEQQVSRQFGPRVSKQSLVASEIARRAMIEGRDVKEALRKGGFGI